MKKNILFSLVLSCLTVLPAAAQMFGEGFYRVQNYNTKRYITIVDNKSYTVKNSGNPELGALLSYGDIDYVRSTPSTIVYINDIGPDGAGYSCNIWGQGTSVFELAGMKINVAPSKSVSNAYRCYGSYKGNIIYLSDEDDIYDPGGIMSTQKVNLDWYVIPISSASDNYTTVKPTVSAGGKNYANYFSGFGSKAVSAGVKFYYICSIEGGKALYKEITGTVPHSTPIIVECPSTNLADNKIEPVFTYDSNYSDNLLDGVFYHIKKGKHNNLVAYDANTMRVLGVCSDGSVGFVTKSAADFDKGALPANSCYLKVPAGSPAELPLMSYESYVSGVKGVQVEDNKVDDITTLSGVTVRKKATSTAGLRPGVYIWNKKKIVVK